LLASRLKVPDQDVENPKKVVLADDAGMR